MYQDFFNLVEFPFNQFPNTEYYFSLENHRQSLDVLNVGLEVNDGIIKIIGRSGTGKSLLCRFFIDKIPDNYHPIYILNPHFGYIELLQYILLELKIDYTEDDNALKLLKLLYSSVVDLKQKNKKLVLIFDEAQYISKEGLEIIQIISNYEFNHEKLCHIILVGGLDLDNKLADSYHLLQRVSFSYTLKPIAKEELESYIYHRLNKATQGNQNHGITFSPKAFNLLYKKTQGVPRLINIVCHKSLMLAYSLGTKHITKQIIKKASEDTDSIEVESSWMSLFGLAKKKSAIADNVE